MLRVRTVLPGLVVLVFGSGLGLGLGSGCRYDASGIDGEGGPPPAIDAAAPGGADADVDAPAPPDAAPPDAPLPDATPPCPPGYVKNAVTGTWYRVESTTRSWTEAESACEAAGGHLVIVAGDVENDQVSAMTTQPFAWLGFTDRVTEGEFRWVNGAPRTYDRWDGGEPNNSWGAEDCAGIKDDGTWNDTDCGDRLESVCECGDGVLVDPGAF